MDIEYAKNRFFGVCKEIHDLEERLEKLKDERFKCLTFVMENK